MYLKEEEAIRFVFNAFKGKKRSKEDIELAFHSITVGYMLKDLGCSEEVVLTGFLHDIIEDTDYDYDYIVSNFSKNIADNVLSISEDLSIINWKDRKEIFIRNLYDKQTDIILVELADKLHNLVSDYDLFKKYGKDALSSSNATYEDNKWYYLEMQKLFNERLEDNKLLKRYNELVNMYFS